MSLGWTIWKMHEDAELSIELGRPEKLAGIVVDELGEPVTDAGVYANLMKAIKIETGEEKKDWLPGIKPMMCLGTRTDNQGKFVFNNLPENTDVGLLIKADGMALIYTTESQTNTTSPIRTGQSDIKLIVMKEGRIEGRITDPDTGKGVAGTKFAVVGSSLFYYRFVHTTNDDGTFRVGGLQTGQYLLRNGGFPSTYVDVESGKTTNINVQAERLSRPRGITGIVRDQQGKPLPNAVVTTCPPMTEETKTDAKGVFTLKSVRSPRSRRSDDGVVYLLVRHNERNLAVATEFDESTDNIEIKLTPGVIFSGRIVDVNGKGIYDANIDLIFWISDLGHGGFEKFDIDPEGNFEIKAVPPGFRYTIQASAGGYGRQNQTVHTSEAGDNTIKLDPLVLQVANLSVSGVVVDVDDKPVVGARVACSGRVQPYRDAQTGAEGKFILHDVCAGSIQISANTPGPTRLYGRASAEGGAKDIKIVVAEHDSGGRVVQKQPPSLAGKSLPDLKGLGFEFSPDDTNDKMILICFFDMQQRPSRNCIMQLGKMIQELVAKDVVVVAIQASKIDKSTLDEWIKGQNISMPIGMIETDEEKTRFNWGVKSLPWLILTDKKKAIQAEGFSIGELGEKITD